MDCSFSEWDTRSTQSGVVCCLPNGPPTAVPADLILMNGCSGPVLEVLRCLAEIIVNFALRWNSMLREHFPFVRDKSAQQMLGNLRRRHALSGMENFEHREKRPATKEEREAKKQRARQEAEIALAARKKEDDAFRANFQRLKAERLAREAATKS